MEILKPSPIAIIGSACRLPGGADTPDRYWEILFNGKNVVSEIPADRWDHRHFLGTDEPGKTYTFRAGTLGDVSRFDATFFGISPREAEQIDPQQRLLLELTWEALERSGQIPDSLADKDCAVYVGVSATDYADTRQGDPASLNAYFMLGSTLSIAANRISYVFDLHGPSMAIDTACSSALVALYEAVHAIRDGRARMAVVGAVNMLLSPFAFIGFSKASMLSPYGLCRAFDKLASGYVRAEGGGALVLKPLVDAERDGDPILAVIKGVGVNTDGRTQGIALPSSERQEELLRRVYAECGADPANLAYLEAHGTGTAVGDPAETAAIGRALSLRRPKGSPLPIGSAKSNLGHLEPASGMAGVIKAIEVLRRRTIPPTLHVDEPNPDIDFDGLNLVVARAAMPLPETPSMPLVGVNSFGFGGANAHVVLEAYEAPATPRPTATERPRPPLLLSARAPSALAQSAQRLVDALDRPTAPAFADVAWTLACRRSHLSHRVALRSTSDAGLLTDLRAFAEGRSPVGAVSGKVLTPSPKVAFVYSGNGAQWLGMGTQLLTEDAFFRAEVERIDALVHAQGGWSVIEELHAAAENSRIADTRFSQPLLFAVQAGITAALAARGLRPEALTGHSVGEVAAAYAAGVLDLERAVHLILSRSNIQGRTRGMGRMAAVAMSPEQAVEAIRPFDGAIELAAYNSPSAVTLSGDAKALLALKERLGAEGVDVRLLDLDYAFHNRVLEPFRQELLDTLGPLSPARGAARTYSSVTGGLIDGGAMDGEYWWANIRQPVRFRQAIEAMAADGFTILVEIGPHPIIQSYIRQTVRGLEAPAQPVATVNRQNAGANRLDRAADEAWVLGASMDWDAAFPEAGTCVDLPSYPWQRERHWFPVTPEARGPLYHRWEGPLLGWRPAPGVPLWEATLSPQMMPFLADHQVGGAVVFPAAGFVEIALEASRQLFGMDRHDIEQMEIRRPLVLDRLKVVRLSWNAEQSEFQIASRAHMADEPWSVHVTGRLSKAAHEKPPAAPTFDPSTQALQVEPAEHYSFAESIGLVYGPLFQTVCGVTVNGDTALAALAPLAADGYELHPAAFDGCLQALFNILKGRILSGDRPHAFLPSQFGRLLIHQAGAQAAACHIRLTRESLRSIVADFVLVDAQGIVVAEARACRFQRMELGRPHQPPARYGFQTVPLTAAGPERLKPIAPAAVPAAADPLTEIATAFAAEAAGIEAAEGRAELKALVDRLASCSAEPAETLWRRATAAHPDYLAELAMLGRAGLHLADVLVGGDASAALPSPATLEHFLDASPTLAGGHDALVDALAAMVAAWPSHRRLRVVEVGGRSIGLTRRLMACLPADGFDYIVAVTDPDAVPAIAAALGTQPGRQVAFLDPSVSVTEQESLEAGRHDLVIVADCLYAWDTTAAALSAIADLGADGAAVLVTTPAPTPWLELVSALHAVAGRPFPLRPATDLVVVDGNLDCVTITPVAGSIVITATVSAPRPAAAPACSKAPWLILAGASGAEAALAEALAEELGGGLVVHPAGDGAPEDAITIEAGGPGAWRDLLATLKEADSEPVGLIHMLGLCDADEAAPEAQLALQDRRCWTALAFAQGLLHAGLTNPPRFVAVTHNALAGAAAQAPLWGVSRVLRNEFPQMGVRQIDLVGSDVPSLAAPLATEIAALCDEDEVILGADRRLGLRLKRHHDGEADTGEAETLSFASGSLDHLTWVPTTRRPPAEGEVEIAVRASGLNFRDIMLALGALPDEAVENGFAGATVGMEAAGVVTRVGPGKSDLHPGDEVLFFAPACFSSHITAPTTAVARKPGGINFATAATIPTTFFTVYYALHELARLQPGERVLIHGAAGGVGLAAIQYCRHVGAEIFATAGTPEKRDIVRLAGVAADHILDSRTLEFEGRIRALTNGEGVDVVLNSLSGEAIHKSLSVIRPFGRFLELGKRDFFANTPLGLRPFRNNISYFGIDADQLMAVRPDLASRLFAEMMELFDRGVFSPLPYRVFPRDRIVDAFRHMQQSRHIGKIIVDGRPPAKPAATTTATDFTLDPQACYLVTGGLGGFGLATARWLATRGARYLVLASRRGATTEEAKEAVATLEAMGVSVTASACDVTDAAQVQALVKSCPRPLKGVVHAAAIFDDAIAANMTREQFMSVLAPKLVGGWALHQATMGLALDFFVLYSSITTVLGNPGQANYVAANLYLEALAHHRRALGLPALAVGWGAIADAGYLTRNNEVRDSLAKRMGVKALTTEAALARLESLLVAGAPAATAVADVDWQTLGTALPALKSPRFSEVAVRPKTESASSQADLATLLAGLSPAEVREVLIELVAEQVGAVLRLPPDRLDKDTSIFDMGMDSLMGLELRSAIEDRFGVDLPAMAISEGASISRLAERIRDHLVGGAPVKADPTWEVSALLARHATGLEAHVIMSEAKAMEAGEQGAKVVA